jgi:hypothetical protein
LPVNGCGLLVDNPAKSLWIALGMRCGMCG